jgi:hypothetical protein
MNRNTILITLGTFLGLILLAVVGYFFFIGTPGASPSSENEVPIFGEIPDGGVGTPSTTNNGGVTGGVGEEVLPVEPGVPPRLHQIATKPVSGASIFTSTSTGLYVRFVERESGHVYEGNFMTSEQKRISITTIPKIYEAIWLDRQENVLLRLLSEVGERTQTFLGKITPNPSGGATTGNYLEDGISSLAVDSRGKNTFYIRTDADGTAGVVADFTTGKRTKVFASSISEWLPFWLGTSQAVLTKPAASVPGYFYRVSSTGLLDRILGDRTGLTVLPSPDGKRILYSESLGDTLLMYVLTVASGKTVTTAVSTLPEKCVWSKKTPSTILCAVPFGVEGERGAVYPDYWYQGRVSFNDNLWSINADTGASLLMYRFKSESEKRFDVESPSLSPSEDYLLFHNKKDLTLWSVRLSTSTTP